MQNAEEEGCSEALAEARRLLESPSTKSAASAYTAVADVANICNTVTHSDVQTAMRAVRDVLVMRCRSQAVPGDRRSFLDTAEEAFGRPLHQELRAVLLLSYHKNIKNKFNRFPSNSQLHTVRRGRPRPRRKRGTIGDAPAGPALEDSGGHAAAPNRGASQPATDASPTLGASQTPSDAPVVEPAQEFRQALDGEWYTVEDFMQYYGSSIHAGWYYWTRAVRKAVLPAAAQPSSSSVMRPSSSGHVPNDWVPHWH